MKASDHISNLDSLFFEKMTSEELAADHAKEIATVTEDGQTTKRQVLNYISDNPNASIKEIVEKFGLHSEVIKDYGNGLVLAGFYSGQDCLTLCIELRMPYNELVEL